MKYYKGSMTWNSDRYYRTTNDEIWEFYSSNSQRWMLAFHESLGSLAGDAATYIKVLGLVSITEEEVILELL
jgi:hypothetical protein